MVSIDSGSLEAFSTGVITSPLQLASTTYRFSTWDSLPPCTLYVQYGRVTAFVAFWASSRSSCQKSTKFCGRQSGIWNHTDVSKYQITWSYWGQHCSGGKGSQTQEMTGKREHGPLAPVLKLLCGVDVFSMKHQASIWMRKRWFKGVLCQGPWRRQLTWAQ